MKRFYFLSLFLLLMVSTLTVAQITVKFQKPASWTAVSLYSYGTSEVLGGWPGTALTATNGWYTYTFPSSYASGTLIFNNAGAGQQTVDYPISTSVCLQASSVLNTGGKYDITTVACAAGFTVKIQKPTAWTSIYLYAYVNGSPIIGAWPGVQLTVDSNGWGTYTFDASATAVNIIFNNNSGSQATDTYITSSSCFTSDGATLTSVACTTGVADITEVPHTIYPNPIVDKLNYTESDNIERVSVHSLTGQNVLSITQPPVNGVMDVTVLKPGVYFVSIDYTNGKNLTEKIIKL